MLAQPLKIIPLYSFTIVNFINHFTIGVISEFVERMIVSRVRFKCQISLTPPGKF